MEVWVPNEITGYEHDRLILENTRILEEITGFKLMSVDPKTPFLEMGLDSLSLVQFAWALYKRYNVSFSFRELFEDYPSLDHLSAEIKNRLPSDQSEPPSLAGWFDQALSGGESCDDGIKDSDPEIEMKQPASAPLQADELSCSVPVTESQLELWLSAIISPQSNCAYNESMQLHFRGELNCPALIHALEDLVQRHEALRITFSPDGQRMKICQDIPVVVGETRLDELEEDERTRQYQMIRRKQVEMPFDLEHGPLFRFELVYYASREFMLFITAHHLVCDGWSWRVLISDLRMFYLNHCMDTAVQLPDAQKFSDYALQEKGLENSKQYSLAEKYWLSMYADHIPVLHFPTDRPHPPVRTFNASRIDWEIHCDLLSKLRQKASASGCSLFVLLLAGLEVYFHRLSGQEDIVIGIPVAGQNSAGMDHLVGHCVNLLPMRSCVDGSLSFDAYLVSRRTAFLDAYDHRQITFGRLLKKLHLKRDPARVPLVQVAFNLETYNKEAAMFEGLEVDYSLNPRSYETFEIFINAVDYNHHLVLEVQYNTDLLDESTMRRRMAELITLLAGIVENSDCPMDRLPLLPEEEKHKLLVDWNQTKSPYPRLQSIQELFEAQVQRSPQAVAVVHGHETLTYAELNRRANCLAHYLKKEGITVETLVGLSLERSPDLLVGLLGIIKAGGAYVPLDPAYPAQRLAFMAQDTGMTLILSHRHLSRVFSGINARVICLDSDWSEIEKFSCDNPPCETSGDSLAYVMYTSGSTGEPKGSCIEHKSINRLVKNSNFLQILASDTVSQTSNASFDAATLEIWGTLLNGAKLVFYPLDVFLSPMLFARRIKEDGISVMWLTTGLFNQLAATVPDAFASLRCLMFGGQAAAPRWVREVLQKGKPACLINGYGPTESTTFAACYNVEEISEQCINLPIGRPISNTTLYILDSLMQPVPIGVTGELYIGGDGLSRCYHNRPELTREKFVPHPFVDDHHERLYRTGDLARYLPDGNIEFLGRIDSQVKIRGFRIELGEVEHAINHLPGIRDCVVIAQEDTPERSRLVAYLVAQGEQKPSIHELRTQLKETLPDYMLPSLFVFLDALPLTPNGKVDLKTLPLPAAVAEAPSEYRLPGTVLEKSIARIWLDILDLHKVGLQDNFFELGGDSLKAIQAISRLNQIGENFDVTLPPSILFDGSTIEQIAAYIEKESAHKNGMSKEISGQARQPLFIFCGAADLVNIAPYMGRQQKIYLVDWDRYVDTALTIEEMAVNCLEFIRRVQFEGPYFLAGFCFGGYVMYEVAQQLHRAGEQVACLIMIDTLAFLPAGGEQSAGRKQNNFDETRSVCASPGTMPDTFGKNHRIQGWVNTGKKYLYSLWFSVICKNIWWLVFHTLLKAGLPLPDVIKSSDHALYYARDRYRPQRYNGNITTIDTIELIGSLGSRGKNGQNGWETYADSVQRYILPGSHREIFSGITVKLLAEKLQETIHHSIA